MRVTAAGHRVWRSAGRCQRPDAVEMGQHHAQVELDLVVVGLHVGAQLVEGLVVRLLLQMGQFVHGDHAQERGRQVAEQRGDADLALGLELAALHPRDRGVGAQRVGDHLQLVVVTAPWTAARRRAGTGSCSPST